MFGVDLTGLEDISHPVHFVQKSRRISSSAFIPFCEFGGDIPSLGVEIDQMEVPVCNSFQAKILNDQLCYEVDPNKYKKGLSKEELKQGLKLYIDTNNDRQTYPKDTDFMIYLDTMGKYNNITTDRYYL